ncbi:MAG: HAMP domain-containing histidine kinase [Rhodobacteraceae bacterium]|nr:HAMP domain-containing histidine kinase [Paracoccaceae bacterium]MCP5341780.1 HAMP domain-containing histidine kinase [Paracoccaceae bacterium]
MDRGNVLSGAAFTAVLMSAVAFVVVLITVGVLSHGYVARTMKDEMRADIDTRWNLFAADYRDEGVAPLTELIESAIKPDGQGQHPIGLFDSAGTRVAGNVRSLPGLSGWQEGSLDLITHATQREAKEGKVGFLYRSGALDGHILIVGQRMDGMYRSNRAVFRTLAATGFVVVLTMLATGYLLSRKSQAKLERMEEILARVSKGDVNMRMMVSPENDQIDRVAARMNTQLDTLARLMVSTRATVAAVAHDLRSPLARAYLGLGRALDRIEAGDDPRAEVEDTQAELERMTGIFDTYLRLSRIEAGADGVTFDRVDLAPLLDDLAETYQMVAEDAAQTLVYERPGEGRLEITGDAAMLQQMVVNLLQNAVTHGSQGNRILLRLNREAGQIRMTVADTGPGIPAAAREAVFEPFRRLDASRTRAGSGLGLALVRAIVERHGARISLSDNAPGLRVVVEFAAADAL